jgi:4-hydroxy-tetrahydrodipicolinate reductase
MIINLIGSRKLKGNNYFSILLIQNIYKIANSVMKLAIIGYGKMGREIEKTALNKGYEVVIKIDKENPGDLDPGILSRADVAVEFTTPDTARENIRACFRAGIPVVCGTTGWTGGLDYIEQLCRETGQTFFYASNFSIGVNILFRLNQWLADVMNRFPEFNVELSEVHHIHKKDAPSGTALTLAEDIIKKIARKKEWTNKIERNTESLSVLSERTGEIPGTHIITYKSPDDILEISHRALNRSIFASGAVLAAEFIKDKKGVFRMDDLLNI